MAAWTPEQKVLSYHDSLLTISDLYLLDGPRWLNDKLIGFAFEYFEHDEFRALADRVAFVGPEVTQFIKLSNDEDVGIFLDPLNLPNKDYVFLAINDHQSENTAGGCHWSLLVCNRAEGRFSHYDSAGSSNQGAAMILCSKLHRFLKGTGDIKLVAEECPQQGNGYDCGLFVICIAEHLCRQMVEGGNEALLEKVTGTTARNKRKDLKSLILALSKETAR